MKTKLLWGALALVLVAGLSGGLLAVCAGGWGWGEGVAFGEGVRASGELARGDVEHPMTIMGRRAYWAFEGARRHAYMPWGFPFAFLGFLFPLFWILVIVLVVRAAARPRGGPWGWGPGPGSYGPGPWGQGPGWGPHGHGGWQGPGPSGPHGHAGDPGHGWWSPQGDDAGQPGAHNDPGARPSTATTEADWHPTGPPPPSGTGAEAGAPADEPR